MGHASLLSLSDELLGGVLAALLQSYASPGVTPSWDSVRQVGRLCLVHKRLAAVVSQPLQAWERICVRVGNAVRHWVQQVD